MKNLSFVLSPSPSRIDSLIKVKFNPFSSNVNLKHNWNAIDLDSSLAPKDSFWIAANSSLVIPAMAALLLIYIVSVFSTGPEAATISLSSEMILTTFVRQFPPKNLGRKYLQNALLNKRCR